MSTSITCRFYLGDREEPLDDLLCKMARTFVDWPQAKGTWSELRGLKRNFDTESFRWGGPLTTDAVCSNVAGRGGADGMLATRTSFRCWRFRAGAQPEEGSVAAGLEVMGREWTTRNHEDRRIGGDAVLVVYDCGPFSALVGEGADPRRDSVNLRVRENLDAFTGLVLRLIEALEPRSAKVFTDEGLFLPFNAHLAYYRDATDAVDDLKFIADIWQRGLPRHQVGPLASAGGGTLGAVMHGWRSSAQREAVWRSFDEAIRAGAAPTVEAVREVSSSNRFDTFSMPVGFTILEYPDFMNSFLDRFYLEVLRTAGA